MKDLISREAVLNGKFDCLTTEVNREMYGRLSDIADYVKSIPAADSAKVVHGKWGELDYDFDRDEYTRPCSNCGKRSVEYMKPYCPNCGARMDGE